MNPIWLLRAKKWLENPPSWKRVRLGMAITAVCFALYGIEQFFGWPEKLTPNRIR